MRHLRRSRHLRLLLPALSASLLASLAPMAIRAQAPRDAGAITIGKRDSIWSGILKERRQLLIYTPASYGDTAHTPQRYPVLFLLDGDAHFHSVTGLLQILGSGINGTFAVPEMIVVAIPNTDRMRDLTPTHVDAGLDGKPSPAMKTSGGMPNFLKFIQTELIPHIDSTYRTAPYRVLVGHSLGGITAIEALYTMPQTFNAYVAIDPSLWWDHQRLLRQAKDYFRTAQLAHRALFVGQANTLVADDTTTNLHFASIAQFNSVAEAYNQSGLRYAYRYYPDDDHGSVPLAAEYDALRFIFAGYKLDLQRSMSDPTYLRAHFAQVSSELGYEVKPPEAVIDLLAQFAPLIDSTKVLSLVQLNAELYPSSASAQSALGDAWLAKGERAKAIAAYERAVALKPSNAHAAAQLKKLRDGKAASASP